MNKLFKQCGLSAWRVLGFYHYLLLWLGLLIYWPTILRTKKLTSLDKWMSRRIRVRFHGKSFIVDCRTIDAMTQEPSYTFSLIREIYIQKCYFQFSDLDYKFINVVDLGGNRGIFSILASHFADTVIYVEAQQQYQRNLQHNMDANNVKNIRLVHAYMGAETSLKQDNVESKSLDDIMRDNNLDSIDFLKIDIEGSEFSLFETIQCLHRVKYIALEVHPHYGDPNRIIQILIQNKFDVALRDNNLKVIHSPLKTELFYIYASQKSVATA